jgi:hypothetical protein
VKEFSKRMNFDPLGFLLFPNKKNNDITKL